MPLVPKCSLKSSSNELIKYYYTPLEKRLCYLGCIACTTRTVISRQPWIYPLYSLPTLAILPIIKLICGGPDSHYCVRGHLHKLVYMAIVMIIGVWSPVSANEKNISSIQIDMSAKALAFPIIGHRGHPGKVERRHLMWQKNLLCSLPLSQTDKTACTRLKCDTQLCASCDCPSKVFSCKISLMVSINITHVRHRPCRHSLSHSLTALFVHSVAKGCDSQFRRLQTNIETRPCRDDTAVNLGVLAL